MATRQSIAAQGRSGKLVVSGKLRIAVDAMVWSGARRAEAATAAGMTDHGLRHALTKGHVKRYYNAQLEALRESERPRNLHRLLAIRDQDDNKAAAVASIKVLEQMGDEAGRPGGSAHDVVAGYVIAIPIRVEQPSPQPAIIGAKPAALTIEHMPAESYDPNDVLWLDGSRDD